MFSHYSNTKKYFTGKRIIKFVHFGLKKKNVVRVLIKSDLDSSSCSQIPKWLNLAFTRSINKSYLKSPFFLQSLPIYFLVGKTLSIVIQGRSLSKRTQNILQNEIICNRKISVLKNNSMKCLNKLTNKHIQLYYYLSIKLC